MSLLESGPQVQSIGGGSDRSTARQQCSAGRGLGLTMVRCLAAKVTVRAMVVILPFVL